MCIWETIYFKKLKIIFKEEKNKRQKNKKKNMQNICTIGKELPQHTTDIKKKILKRRRKKNIHINYI